MLNIVQESQASETGLMQELIDKESPAESNMVMPQEVDKSQAMLDISTEPRVQK